VDTELTPERQQVLELIEAGNSVREIAKALDISTQRVYQQLQKLGVSPSGATS
jgi:DNA-binding NarL/FixJ family response regulator